MTGLAIAAPLAGNIGAFLGIIPENSGGVAAPAGGLAFLDLLGLIGEGMSAEELVEIEGGPITLQTSAAPATPKNIAAAIIRSMLQAPASTRMEAEAALVEESEPPQAAVATAVEEDEDDWDVPFDWVAPEEEREEFGHEDPRQEEFRLAEIRPEEFRYSDSPRAVVQPLAGTPGEVHLRMAAPGIARQTEVPQEARASVRTFAQAALPKTAAPGQEAAPRRARLMEPLAPLAFALTLKALEPQEDQTRGGVQTQTGTETEMLVVLPAQAVTHTATHAERIPVAAPAVTEAGSELSSVMESLGHRNVPKREGSEEESEEESEYEAPVVPARGRVPKTGTRAEGILAEATPAPAIPAVSQGAVSTPARDVPLKPVEADPGVAQRALGVESKEAAQPRAVAAHEIAVRISGPDASPVDVRVKERGGEVHVAVRTPDGALQTLLRQDLGSLVDRLEQTGLHAKALVPGEPQALVPGERGLRVEAGAGVDLSSVFRAQAADATGGPSGDPRERDGSGAHDSGPGARQQNPQRRQQQPQRWAGLPQDEEQA